MADKDIPLGAIQVCQGIIDCDPIQWEYMITIQKLR